MSEDTGGGGGPASPLPSAIEAVEEVYGARDDAMVGRSGGADYGVWEAGLVYGEVAPRAFLRLLSETCPGGCCCMLCAVTLAAVCLCCVSMCVLFVCCAACSSRIQVLCT